MRLRLRVLYLGLQFSHYLFLNLSVPGGSPCLSRVPLSLWCCLSSQLSFPVPLGQVHPHPYHHAIVCLWVPPYFPVLRFPN